jgi:hypothetical protein
MATGENWYLNVEAFNGWSLTDGRDKMAVIDTTNEYIA